MPKLEVTIGQDNVGRPVIFVKGNNPQKVADAYLEAMRRLNPKEIIKKEKDK